MFSNIRRAIDNLQSHPKEGLSSDGGAVDLDTITDQIKVFIKDKAEQDDVRRLSHGKSNKIDTEMCLRWVDLLHRMVK
jgi:hypothetical protein